VSDLRDQASKKKKGRKTTAVKYKAFGIAMLCGLNSSIQLETNCIKVQ